MLIAGEPGIGKTRLLEEVMRHSREEGWTVLLGHAYDSEGMPPYLPFIEALQDYVRLCPLDELTQQLGSGAADIGRLIPEVGRRIPTLVVASKTDPESERYRLFESVADFLERIAEVAPRGVLLCLDDLHWADATTLLLVEHLARRSPDVHVVMLATYRDTDLEVGRPLARTLEELARRRLSHLLDLRRLNKGEVGEMLASLGRPNPPAPLVEAMYSETEGNPFFVKEVYEYLADAERLFDVYGNWREVLQVSETDVPQSVRLVVGRRLEHLSERCRRVLSFAAVLGRGFDHDLLAAVSEQSTDELLDSLDEAERAHLLKSGETGRVTFEHELIRQTLLSDLSALRRQRIHLNAASAIEKLHVSDVDLFAADLAHHYLESGTEVSNLRKALSFARLAARNAVSVYAYGEAVRMLDRALEIQVALDPQDRAERCELLQALISALLPARGIHRVLEEVAPAAYSLAESLDDESRMGSIARSALDAAQREWGTLAVRVAPGTTWLERADLHTDAETPERVFVDKCLANRLHSLGLGMQRGELASKTYRLARRLGRGEPLFWGASAMLHAPPPISFVPEMGTILREMDAESREGASFRTLSQFLGFAGEAWLVFGNREASGRMLFELESLAAKANDANVQDDLIRAQVTHATIDGRFDEAIAFFQSQELINAQTRTLALMAISRIRMWRGQFDDLTSELEKIPGLWSTTGVPTYFQVASMMFLATAGQKRQANILHASWSAAGEPSQGTVLNQLLWALEAAVKLENRDLALQLAQQLEPVSELSMGTLGAFVSPGRLIGDAFALLQDAPTARTFYSRALEAAQKISFRPEIALNHLHTAELILKYQPLQRLEANEHLDVAIDELEEMGMLPALQRALRLRGRRRQPVDKRTHGYPDGITEREAEVLRLISSGHTNREISAELVLSVRTVARHITNIYSKIGARSKAEATAYAIREGLN